MMHRFSLALAAVLALSACNGTQEAAGAPDAAGGGANEPETAAPAQPSQAPASPRPGSGAAPDEGPTVPLTPPPTQAPASPRPVPIVCTREYAPVCGVDGRTYGNACEARAADAAVARQGAC